MHVLLISPYHGGSHKMWAEGYRESSQHSVALLTLPARFWKWRMHGGAVTLARRFLASDSSPDLILATDMLDLTTFLAITRRRTSGVRSVIYMHENQLTYPLPEDGTTGPMRRQLGERDRHYAFINYASMLAADQILFNSRYHHDCFFAALPNFLKHFPEYNELNSATELYEKSEVVPVGVNLRRLDQTAERRIPETSGKPPLILWNQRWEYDKNPEGFFAALMILADRGIPFRVALCGQQYGKQPAVFADAGKRLGDQVVHEGFANADLYAKLLWEADITISTAWHEFFGISIIEAIYARTFPLLPTRLSYPEIIPKSFHAHCLYDDQEGLVKRLQWALTHTKEARVQAKGLATAVSRYDWLKIAPRYDQMMYTIVNS